ncbi:MAG TPA: YciI family protein [Candidatus Limnocylindria bacterium]
MTHYLLSVHTAVDATPAAASGGEEAMRAYAKGIEALEGEMRSAGALVFSGRLDEPKAAAVVRAANGTVQTTDGPFIESKEAIGGFYIIEAPSQESAREWATKTSAVVGMPIEIRPFIDARQG